MALLKNDVEYRRTRDEIARFRASIVEQQEALRQLGLTESEITRVCAPMQTMLQDLEEQTREYDAAKAFQFPSICGLDVLQRYLILARVASGLSASDLAERLGVSAALISRAECNEHHGISLTRAQKLLDALGARIQITLTPREPPRTMVVGSFATALLDGLSRDYLVGEGSRAVTSGEEALELLRRDPPDALVLLTTALGEGYDYRKVLFSLEMNVLLTMRTIVVHPINDARPVENLGNLVTVLTTAPPGVRQVADALGLRRPTHAARDPRGETSETSIQLR